MLNQSNSIQDFLKKCYSKKVILFGTGSSAWSVRNIPISYKYCVDNNSLKWGEQYQGLEIFSPETINQEDESTLLIVIASMYYKEIAQQLVEHGFKENVHFYNGLELRETWEKLKTPKLESYKNIHQGRRAFLIGNGPSLNIGDLEKLTQELTFAANKIYLAFNETKWRPTYYCVEDYLVAQNCREEISNLELKDKFFPTILDKYLGNINEANWIDFIGPIEGSPAFSKDITKHYHGGWTVIYFMIQLAYFMGIKEIYLLGIDYKFEIPNEKNDLLNEAGVEIISVGEKNHFHPDYRKKGEKWYSPALSKQYESFQFAEQVFREAGGKIYNASRKTALDVFDIVNLDDIIINRLAGE